MKLRTLILLIIAGTLNAQSSVPRLKALSESRFDEAVKLRHTLHKIPEPCYLEKATRAFIINQLQEMDLAITSDIGGKGGIKAVLEGGKPGHVVAIRADMDALPITEATDLDWQSKNEGFMHACGHDIHMTNGLMTAKILSEIRDELPGTVVFIFQPCEEGTGDGTPAGGETMVKSGILKNPDVEAVFGLHVMPGYEIGSVALRPGPIMANVATIKIAILGKSSHGASPHQGVDAVYAASSAVMQMQSIISRMKDPGEKAVISIGKINGGTRMNILADRVDMEGTVRSFSFDTETLMEERIRGILDGLKVSQGIDYEYGFHRGSKYVNNDENLATRTETLFKSLLGADKVYRTEPVTIGEDFSFYSHAVPSLFFFLGAGDGSLHHPEFAPDDEILKYGGWLLAEAAVGFLEGGQ